MPSPEDRSTFIRDDCTFAHECHGSGPRVLFLNGSGATIDMVRPLVSVLARHLTVAIHDQRGLGQSSIPEGPYTMADYAEDALAFMDHLGWETCGVLGISFGGMVAQELAVTWPDRVERLLLACTSAGGTGGSSYPLHELFDLDDASRLEKIIPLTDRRFTDDWLAERPQDRAYFSRATESDSSGERVDRQTGHTARQGARWQLEARRHHDVWDRLSRITCRTLVMSGRYDGIAPEANSAAIVGQLSNAEHRVYEGGHHFFVQDPRALPDMSAFLLGEDEAS